MYRHGRDLPEAQVSGETVTMTRYAWPYSGLFLPVAQSQYCDLKILQCSLRQPQQGFFKGDLALIQLSQNFSLGGPWLYFHKLKVLRNPVRTVFDRRITYTEDALHVLDRTVAPYIIHDEFLLLLAKLRQRWKLETPFDGDLVIGQFHSCDGEGYSIGDSC